MERLIAIIDLHLSERVCGAFRFVRKSFLNDLIITVDLSSYNS